MPHPSWDEMLAQIPESVRPIVSDTLKRWDTGVRETLEERNRELENYKRFKPFVEANVDPEWLAEAADLAYQFQQNTKGFVERANEVYDLGFVSKDSVQQQAPDNEYGLDDEDMDELSNNPKFKQLMTMVESLSSTINEDRQSKQDREEAERFEAFLDEQLKEKKFDKDFVTAYMANGATFDQALDKWNGLVAGFVGDDANEKEQEGESPKQSAPVVMGGDGSGSGGESKPISFGNMKESDLEDLVEQMLAGAAGDES